METWVRYQPWPRWYGRVGIAGVVGVEAMGHCDRLPCGYLFAVPDFPWAAECSLEVLPPFSETSGCGPLRWLSGVAMEARSDRIRQQRERRSDGAGLQEVPAGIHRDCSCFVRVKRKMRLFFGAGRAI